jgi:hypothetical protein
MAIKALTVTTRMRRSAAITFIVATAGLSEAATRQQLIEASLFIFDPVVKGKKEDLKLQSQHSIPSRRNY